MTSVSSTLATLLPARRKRTPPWPCCGASVQAFKERGAALSGLDVYISSNVPKGSGVSSSAAFEVLIGVILNDRFMAEKVSPIAIAQIGQWAENVYFGKPCGLMDQMASSVGNIITIDFADPAHPDRRAGARGFLSGRPCPLHPGLRCRPRRPDR